MAGNREQMEGAARQGPLVDWAAVDEEIKSVPSEYRDVIFHPLKHVVEVFSSADPQGLTQELREASERLGYQLDAVVEGYHAGFARSIQNYSQILHLFQDSKEQVDAMKRSLADAAKQLGTQSRYLTTQWRKTVSLESSLRLLADIGTVVDVPARVDAALTARDWPRAVSCLLEGATLLAHEELRRVGALRKLRSDMVSLAGWIQDQMMDELTARIFSGARASTSAAAPGAVTIGLPGAPGRMGLGGLPAGGGAGAGGAASHFAAVEGARGAQLRVGSAAASGLQQPGRQVPGWRRKGPEPAYKLVTETLKGNRSTSQELRNALSMGSSSLQGPGAGPGGGAGAGGAPATAAGTLASKLATGAGPAGGGGDISVDVDVSMRHVSTRDLVACLAQVDGVAEAKHYVAQRAHTEMRALIRRSIEAFMQASSGQAGAHGGGEQGGISGLGVGSGAAASPAQRMLAQRLVSQVAAACVQALGRLQHVLVELANAPATTQSSALDVLLTLRQGGGGTGAGAGGPRDLLLQRRHRAAGGGGGGLTARERAAYLREEYQKMWDVMQEELQQLLADLLQAGTARMRPPARRLGRGGARGAEGATGGGGGTDEGALGGVRALLADLNPVHFLEQLAALAERTADLAESALGGGGGPPQAAGGAAGARAAQQAQSQAAGGQQQPQSQPQAQAAPRRPPGRREVPGGSRLTFGFDVTVPGLAGDAAQLGAVGALRAGNKDAGGFSALVQRALGDHPGSLQLLPEVYLPALRLVSRAEEVLRLPPDLPGAGAGGGGAAAGASSAPPTGSGPSGPPVVSSWLQHFLDEVVLEQLLPQIWVELRGRCTAALEDAEAFRAQVGFSAAVSAAALGVAAATQVGGAAAAAGAAGGAATSSIAPRSVVPIARFIEGVIQELMAAAAALPPFTSAFLAIAERILDRMLGAFLHMVRMLSVDCPASRLVGRSDVCLAMAAEGDALLLREPVAFAPQPNALPGATPPASGGATATSDLVAFLMSLRTQERPLLVPPQLRPLGASGSSRGPVYCFGADGDAAELELQYFAMRERPTGHERLVFGQGGSDRAVHLAAMSESLDYVAEAVIRLTARVEDGKGGSGGASSGAAGWRTGGDTRRGGGRASQAASTVLQGGAANVPDLLLPVVQSYKALAGHCCRLLRLEALLLVGSQLAPVAATSHVCEEDDSMELHPSLGALTRAALRCSEELAPFLQPTKRAYVFGPLAVAAARGIMWLLPAIHDINSLGVERMIRALSLLQPPLTSLVVIDLAAGVAVVPGGAGGAAAAAAAAGSGAAAAAAAAAAACSVATVSGPGPSASVLAALLAQPETRGERGRAFDRARGYYGLLLVPPDEVVRAATERPERFLYAEWMALLQARVPHRTVTDVALGSLQRCLDRSYGLTPGAKMAEVMGAVVGAVQAPAERLGDVLLEGLVAGKDTVVDVLLAGRNTLVAGVKVPAQTLQRVFKRIGAGAAARRAGGGGGGGGAGAGPGGDGGGGGPDLYRRSR